MEAWRAAGRSRLAAIFGKIDAAEVQRHTGLFGHLIDVIAGGGFFVFNDGVAAQRAGVAAVVADLNLQTLRFAEEELAGAPAVGNLVGAAHIFAER